MTVLWSQSGSTKDPQLLDARRTANSQERIYYINATIFIKMHCFW